MADHIKDGLSKLSTTEDQSFPSFNLLRSYSYSSCSALLQSDDDDDDESFVPLHSPPMSRLIALSNTLVTNAMACEMSPSMQQPYFFARRRPLSLCSTHFFIYTCHSVYCAEELHSGYTCCVRYLLRLGKVNDGQGNYYPSPCCCCFCTTATTIATAAATAWWREMGGFSFSSRLRVYS